jgi:hypothetical protein
MEGQWRDSSRQHALNVIYGLLRGARMLRPGERLAFAAAAPAKPRRRRGGQAASGAVVNHLARSTLFLWCVLAIVGAVLLMLQPASEVTGSTSGTGSSAVARAIAYNNLSPFLP